jgi:hypothetical protein
MNHEQSTMNHEQSTMNHEQSQKQILPKMLQRR